MTYAIFTATITNPESLAAYSKVGAAALEKHGGKVVKMARPPATLDGLVAMPDIAAVLAFPDRASAEAWIGDPELVDAHALRRGAGATSIMLLD
ncbi:hypothetical protein LA6_004783 [Marinibacterium anthonyi]|nr:hypothetical protein LA6_004783 [Marinibacterium anthonyi]